MREALKVLAILAVWCVGDLVLIKPLWMGYVASPTILLGFLAWNTFFTSFMDGRGYGPKETDDFD